ncbi:iron-sulfur cluster carrier protein [Betaproteobacteria bacterium]|nr:iron-sulfur cluster carrier protein [Betaproteobacteria bacterium]GHU41522.1 iron-sulfur cluster carrier protein [Betaproteobacteria bacterium]
MSISLEAVQTALRALVDPNTQKLLSARNVRSEKNGLHVEIEVGYPAKNYRDALEKLVRSALPDVDAVHIEVIEKIVPHAMQHGAKRLAGVKNLVVVASGKGGVGKSTTAVNLALALAEEGARVGILDADIYGPSLPQMLGLAGQHPEVDAEKMMTPLVAHGIQVMSIGFLVPEDAALIWRGPLVVQALNQLLNETRWDHLDYLIVDLPPGTGDVQLSLAQKAPVTGALIVTTPQDIALSDVKRGIRMFEKVGVPILGVVENMSIYTCPHCGQSEHIFGAGGAKRLREAFAVECLGELPLDIQIRALTDDGKPTVVGAPDSHAAALYRAIARKLACKIAAQPKDMSAKFPPIVVQS